VCRDEAGEFRARLPHGETVGGAQTPPVNGLPRCCRCRRVADASPESGMLGDALCVTAAQGAFDHPTTFENVFGVGAYNQRMKTTENSERLIRRMTNSWKIAWNRCQMAWCSEAILVGEMEPNWERFLPTRLGEPHVGESLGDSNFPAS